MYDFLGDIGEEKIHGFFNKNYGTLNKWQKIDRMDYFNNFGNKARVYTDNLGYKVTFKGDGLYNVDIIYLFNDGMIQLCSADTESYEILFSKSLLTFMKRELVDGGKMAMKDFKTKFNSNISEYEKRAIKEIKERTNNLSERIKDL